MNKLKSIEEKIQEALEDAEDLNFKNRNLGFYQELITNKLEEALYYIDRIKSFKEG